MSDKLRAWKTEWGGCTVFIAATTRARARYKCARMAAHAWQLQAGELLPEVACCRAPENDHMATQKGEEGSLHPLDQWREP
jgi:hypothetical protein